MKWEFGFSKVQTHPGVYKFESKISDFALDDDELAKKSVPIVL